ncbi:NAD(P)/FAD-dependent oxidoreductase [Litorilinea aerophila]|uniref:NAD(P)/FAD-dependent oxidoreductase n=1 Tax=Litorilinea aerophila TaxID=1204385 RepID=A0A540VMG1_9CHLR
MGNYDAVVVGAGPNGLAAAITLARAGRSVLVIEARGTIGGGARTGELTLPGFRHDICSAIHPLGLGSPFMRTLPWKELGVEWIQPDIPLAHPLDDGAAALHRSPEETAASLGRDGPAWRRLFEPLAAHWERLGPILLGPHPLSPRVDLLARFGIPAAMPANLLPRLAFRGERARALFAGLAAHSFLDFNQPFSSAFGLTLGLLGHAVGWPIPRGGSQAIVDGMARYLQSLGGDMVCGWEVESLDELPESRIQLLDVTPRQFLKLAGEKLPAGYRRKLERYRYGPGVFKIDYALSEPVPWRSGACRRAGTVHVGGTLAEIAASERDVNRGKLSERPFVLVAQQSLFDETRAPAGQHTLWAYCHVPHGSTADRTEAIEGQIERFAPGFRDVILARAVHNSADYERYNPNYVGGDINGGVQDIRQLWTRPVLRWPPYATPLPGVFLCSSSTPPGGGVHGMCGFHAARAALAEESMI